MVNLDYDDSALQDIIDEIRTATGLNIVPEWNELEVAGIAQDDMVTIHLTQVAAGKALDRILAYVSGGKLGKAGYKTSFVFSPATHFVSCFLSLPLNFLVFSKTVFTDLF